MGPKSQTGGSNSSLKLGIDSQLSDRALRALLKHHESSSSSENELLGNDLDVQVQFSLVRIPGNASPKPIRIEIPHPLVKLSSGGDDAMDDEDDDHLQDISACLIVKEESKPWVQELITRFPTQLGCIKKVLGLQSLRTKHKSFLQRRELLARFDVFLADDRILPMLTKALGGKFFEKKKQPVPVKLTRGEALPFAVERCLRSTFMYLSAGTCVTVKAGNTAMPPAKLLANIQSICSTVPTKVPRKWSNVRSISIKTSSSVALPIYNKTPEELEQIMMLAKKEEQQHDNNDDDKKKEGGSKQEKRKMAPVTPLAKALKKQKAAEEAKDVVATEETPKKKKMSSKKKKRKDSIDGEEVTTKKEEEEAVAKTPKASKNSSKKKRRKESIDSTSEEVATKKEEEPPITKMPKSSSKKQRKSISSKAAAEDTATKDANFISSKKFSGAKKGYVFKKSMLGLGYYKDVVPVVDKAWLATLGNKKSGGRGGGGGSRKSMGHSMKRGNKKGGRRSY